MMVAVVDESKQCSPKYSTVAAKKTPVRNLSLPAKKPTTAVANYSLVDSSLVAATAVAKKKNQPAKTLVEAE